MSRRPDPPVGACCPHEGMKDFAPASMQTLSYRVGEHGWLYYHGWYIVGRGHDMRVEFCGKPEHWRWREHLRLCFGCDKWFSNPWVPVCPDCWDPEEGEYPSWEYVIELEKRHGLPED